MAQRLELKQRVLDLFEQEKFDELDRFAEESRSQKRRLIEGWWELSYCYDVLRRRDQPQNRDDWLHRIEIADRWKAAKPESITARVVLANSWAYFAWYSRGHDDNSTVVAEEKQMFLDRMARSRRILEEAELLPSKDPELYHVMQAVALGEGWGREKYEAMFRKAIQLEPTYYPYYYEKTTYLLPRWYGKPGDLERFAAEAADATRRQEGEIIYMLIACTSYWTVEEGQFFKTYKLSWPRIKQGFVEFDKRYPNNLINLNFFCHIACVAQDKATARELFDRIGTNTLPGYWHNAGEFEQWKRWSHDEADSPLHTPSEESSASVLGRLLRHLLSW